MDLTSDNAPGQPGADPGGIECGRRFTSPPDAALRLAARFPQRVSAAERTMGGTVEVSSERPVRGVGAAAADVFLVRNGQIVTTPVPQDTLGVRWDLAPGETLSLTALAALTSCEPADRPLPRGEYELYVRVVLIPDDATTPQASFGGPWPLHVG